MKWNIFYKFSKNSSKKTSLTQALINRISHAGSLLGNTWLREWRPFVVSTSESLGLVDLHGVWRPERCPHGPVNKAAVQPTITQIHWQVPSPSTASTRGEKPPACFSVLGVAGSSPGRTSYPKPCQQPPKWCLCSCRVDTIVWPGFYPTFIFLLFLAIIGPGQLVQVGRQKMQQEMPREFGGELWRKLDTVSLPHREMKT